MKKCPFNDKPCEQGFEQLIDTTQARLILNVSKQRVCKIAQTKRIKPVKIANRVFFEKKDVEGYAKNRKTGAPRKA